MNTTPRTAQPVNALATSYACAAALIASAETLLRRLGFSEVGNDDLSFIVVDLARITGVLTGRANGAQHGAPAPAIAPSPPITMPEFTHPSSADATYAAMTSPITLPTDDASEADPVGHNSDDDEQPDVIEPAADLDAPAPCAKCRGKGKLFGRPCKACQGAPAVAESHVATVAANAPVAASKPKAKAPAPVVAQPAPVNVDDVPIIGFDDVPPGYSITVEQPTMRNGRPLHVIMYGDERLSDHFSADNALAVCQAHAVKAGRARRAVAQPAVQPAAPVVRQGNSSAPLNAPAPAPKASAKAAPVSAAPVGKATAASTAPVAVAPPANVIANRVARATDALEKGSLKALALACALCGLPVTASAGARAMREALAEWVMTNDDASEADDVTEPAVAPAPVVPSKPTGKGAAKPPVVATVASKPAPVSKPKATVDTSESGGLPLNQWRMLLALDSTGEPMTYKAIDELIKGEFGTSYYSGMTAALRADKPDSLCDQGLCTECEIDVEGKTKFAFVITSKGKALVAKHS